MQRMYEHRGETLKVQINKDGNLLTYLITLIN